MASKLYEVNATILVLFFVFHFNIHICFIHLFSYKHLTITQFHTTIFTIPYHQATATPPQIIYTHKQMLQLRVHAQVRFCVCVCVFSDVVSMFSPPGVEPPHRGLQDHQHILLHLQVHPALPTHHAPQVLRYVCVFCSVFLSDLV